MSNENFFIDTEFVGTRIDKFLQSCFPDKTRTNLQKLIDGDNVLVNDKTVSKNYKLRLNDNVSVSFPPPIELDVIPQDIPISIVYEDDDLLVVNKPKGMVVHPAAGNHDMTLVNALLYHCKSNLSGINGVIRPGIVHRIDKNTSGLLIVAKNDFSHNSLALQIKEHSFNREYEAIVYGNVKEDEGVLDFPIGRNKNDRKKMCVTSENSKEARTEFFVVARYKNYTHVKFKLHTGRTHQIRVHMAFVAHPIVGDDVYGPKKVITKLNGQCLHAKKLGFIHPKSGEYFEFDSELPDYFKEFLGSLQEQ